MDEVLALPKWESRAGKKWWRRSHSKERCSGCPGEAAGGQACQEHFTVLEIKELLPQNLDAAQSLLHLLRRPARLGRWARLDLGCSCAWRGLPLRPPWSLAEGTRGFCREPSWWLAWPRVLWKGPQTFRKSLDKNQCVPASVLHFFLVMFLFDSETVWLDLLWQFSSSQMDIGTLGRGTVGAWTQSLA